MTVSWRRSAVSSGRGTAGAVGAAATCRCALLNGFEIGNRAQQLAAMAEQDAQLLQILISQIGEDAEIDRIVAKRLRVLLHLEAAEQG